MFDEETPIEEMGLPDPLADIIRAEIVKTEYMRSKGVEAIKEVSENLTGEEPPAEIARQLEEFGLGSENPQEWVERYKEQYF